MKRVGSYIINIPDNLIIISVMWLSDDEDWFTYLVDMFVMLLIQMARKLHLFRIQKVLSNFFLLPLLENGIKILLCLFNYTKPSSSELNIPEHKKHCHCIFNKHPRRFW